MTKTLIEHGMAARLVWWSATSLGSTYLQNLPMGSGLGFDPTSAWDFLCSPYSSPYAYPNSAFSFSFARYNSWSTLFLFIPKVMPICSGLRHWSLVTFNTPLGWRLLKILSDGVALKIRSVQLQATSWSVKIRSLAVALWLDWDGQEPQNLLFWMSEIAR